MTDYLAANGYENLDGKALKSTSGWINNGNGTDDFDFTALPGGCREYAGNFFFVEGGGFWWTSTEGPAGSGSWYRLMEFDNDKVSKLTNNHYSGLSVRCIRDN